MIRLRPPSTGKFFQGLHESLHNLRTRSINKYESLPDKKCKNGMIDVSLANRVTD